ncbi:MAG: AMP-binding protein, partial [Saprospiraceae bacterium]|nr:AMP-binding protein [Saprospiraceae bacterium]
MTNKNSKPKLGRLIDLPRYQRDLYPRDDALAKIHGEHIEQLSTDELIRKIDQFSTGLLSLELTKGDKVSIISENRPEWNIVDHGLQQLGLINVPIYPKVGREQFEYIFEDADIRTVFVSNEELYQTAKEAAESVDSVKSIYCFEEVKGADHWTDLLVDTDDTALEKIEKIRAEI